MTRGKTLSLSLLASINKQLQLDSFPKKNVATINYILSNLSLHQVFKAFNPLQRG